MIKYSILFQLLCLKYSKIKKKHMTRVKPKETEIKFQLLDLELLYFQK